MSYFELSLNVSRFRAVLCATLAFSLAGCGGSDSESTVPPTQNSSSNPSSSSVPDVSPVAEVKAVRPGASPFIAFVDLHVASPSDDASVQFTIEPKPGSVSRPVSVNYALSYLRQRGYFDANTGMLTIPVFGLYQNYRNQVVVQLRQPDNSTSALQVTVDTAAYSDPDGIYDRPVIRMARAKDAQIGFDYFYMKSALGSPVVIDTDGEMRWVVPGTMNSFTSTFHDNAFVIGDHFSLNLHRLELDGTAVDMTLSGGSPDLLNFHHNFDLGKNGLLAELDAIDNGVKNYENKLAEFNPTTGVVLKQWDLGDTISRYMRNHGDDPTAFVRPGVDWFHMNSAIYDPSDDSLIISSRENFVIKIDYSSGDLIWILGDPTKYWQTFPSLAVKNLTLAAGGFYPIGQHALSIAKDGSLMLFNDGQGSLNQPDGQPAGQSRAFSVVSRYTINAGTRSAIEISQFDYQQSIASLVCSSVYESASNTSMLVDYAVADNQTHARLVGLDRNQNVAFDFEYPTAGCNTSWNAQPIALDAMTFR
jgi:arylsulfate sulfotransferase